MRSTFTKNRDRLLDHDIADRFFAAAVAQARLRRYLSSDHLSVDRTVLEAWASHKSFKPKDRDPNEPPLPGRNADQDLHGEKRSNKTHEPSTDPEARLYRKSAAAPAKMAYLGHLLMEHRNGLIVDMELTHADGYGERAAALTMIDRLPRHVGGAPSPPTRPTTPPTSSATAANAVHTARRPAHQRPTFRDRWAHRPPPRTSSQPADPQN